ncbi:uncharacterized protein LOC119992630 isoform X2 [Tripterygium wilfordii]|uniref:uncharacterized protein LOC119992630 isoform X2 n=1 Tax=Tripterygium wilfordii TaxID=458696 RepID=UPI0018F83906|nr:uncharacterized protein LOC119992630 isoform X2 [Tripterygium wilfordii]
MTSGCCFSSEESLFEVFHEMRLEWLVGSRLASTESETASGEGCMDCVCSKCRSQGKSIGEHLAAMDLRTGSLLGGFFSWTYCSKVVGTLCEDQVDGLPWKRL